jgi:hypothetical protein
LVPLNVNGNATEYQVLMEFVQRQDLDALFPHIVLSSTRVKIAEFTACTDSLAAALLLPATQLESFIWAPVQPFTVTVKKFHFLVE